MLQPIFSQLYYIALSKSQRNNEKTLKVRLFYIKVIEAIYQFGLVTNIRLLLEILLYYMEISYKIVFLCLLSTR